MTNHTSRTAVALSAVVALMLCLSPVTFESGRLLPTVHEALAGNHGDRGGGGRDSDGRGGGDRGNKGAERGNAGGGNGRARGTEAGHPGRGAGSEPPGLESARQRYDRALDKPGAGRAVGRSFDRGLGVVAATLDDAATRSLIERGWKTHAPAEDGFTNHGERVRTLVELAKALGYDPSVGALQANFGTGPIADPEVEALEQSIADATAALNALDPDAVERAGLEEQIAALEAELAAALDGQPTGSRPGPAPGAWSSANLDVNGDGVVSQADLNAVLAGTAPNRELANESAADR